MLIEPHDSTDSFDKSPVFSPEAQLLFYTARTTLSPAARERILDLANCSLSWEKFVVLIRQHGVLSLAYRSLANICPQAVPSPILAKLHREHQIIAWRGILASQELIRLSRGLEAEKIPLIALKGPVLASSSYGDATLREFCDLDILVPEAEMRRAKKLLLKLGYEVDPAQLTSLQEDAGLYLLRYHYEFHGPHGQVVELHWGLFDYYFGVAAPAEDFWQSRTSVSMLGHLMPSLGGEELLLYLCLHGSKHAWRRLMWVCDVNETLRSQPALNWGRIYELAAKLRCRRMLLLGLALAKNLLDASLPSDVQEQIARDSQAIRLAQELPYSTQFSNRATSIFGNPCHHWQARRLYFHFACRDGLRERLAYVGCIFTEKYVVVPALRPLPPYLTFLYRLPALVNKRWKRLLAIPLAFANYLIGLLMLLPRLLRFCLRKLARKTGIEKPAQSHPQIDTQQVNMTHESG